MRAACPALHRWPAHPVRFLSQCRILAERRGSAIAIMGIAATLGLVGVAPLFSPAFGREPTEKTIVLSDAIGPEIDAAERQAYGLFPDLDCFQTGRLLERANGSVRLEYTCDPPSTPAAQAGWWTHAVTADAVALTRLHVSLVDAHQREPADSAANPAVEAACLRRLLLRQASRLDYETASELAGVLRFEYSETEEGRWAAAIADDLERLSGQRTALIHRGTVVQHEGRTEFLIFAGYYGLWLGIATPIALDADGPETFGASILLIPATTFALAHFWSREANLSDARAAMMSFGAHLGTWQGIGWSVYADRDGRDVVAVGEFAGLAGLFAAGALTSRVEFSEGDAALTGAALPWGAWFGVVGATLAGSEGDGILASALFASDALVLATGFGAKDARVSEKRVRLINLVGLAGGIAGAGACLLGSVDDGKTYIGVAGAGSIAGLIAGAHWTRGVDREKDFGWVAPQLLMRPDPAVPGSTEACLALSLRLPASR